jgi:ABC-type lipoprotein export system ATPase subunit
MKLILQDVSVVYDRGEPTEITALQSCRLEISKGEPLVVCGGNGSGKTTLLKILAGIIQPDEGSVLLTDHGTTKEVGSDWLRHNSDYVRQQPISGLFPDLTLAENFALRIPAEKRRFLDPYYPSSKFREQEEKLVTLAHFYARYRHRRVMHLSGGEQQIFAISVAEYADHPVILLDEPTSALDERIHAQVEQRLRAWLARTDRIAVLVTHDMGLAKSLGFRTVVMKDQQIHATINCPRQARNVGWLPTDLCQRTNKDCLPAAYRILSGRTLSMADTNIGDEKKTLDALRAAGETVEFICRKEHEKKYPNLGKPCEDAIFFEKVEAYPSILCVEETPDVDHAIACVGCMKINPRHGIIIEQSVSIYWQPKQIFAAFLFSEINIDQCANRIRGLVRAEQPDLSHLLGPR